VPDVETINVFPLVLSDHKMLPAQPLAVNVTLVPAQTILSASSELILGEAGIGFTTIVCVADAKLVQPFKVQVAL
jgi:hypothetical protein